MIFQTFGTIQNPLATFGSYGDLQSGGLIAFLSNVIKLIIIVGGVWAFINLVLAGFQFITATNPDQIASGWKKIYMSLIGLGLLVGSYTLAAVIGLVLFGDPTAILNPQIYGP